MPDVFIDYRPGDGESTASPIEDNLSNRFGSVGIFRDNEPIRSGENHPQALARGVASCRVLIAISGPSRLAARNEEGRNALDDENDWGRREVVEASEHGLTAIPVLAGVPVKRLPRAVLPPALVQRADCQWMPLDHPGNSRNGLARLTGELTGLPGLVERAEQGPRPDEVRNTLGGDATRAGQMRDHNRSGGISTVTGGTVIDGASTGPGRTGSGNLFGGGGLNVVERNSGGVHQSFGASHRHGGGR